MIHAAVLLTFLFTAVFTGVVIRTLGFRLPRRPLDLTLLLLFAVITVLLIARPDEEVEAGEDAAAYFNAAQVYLRTGTLHPSDPALTALPPAQRPLFRYGDARFMITKDHTLWARDPGMDPVSVFFFPAYSFLLGAPMLAGFPYGAFWISGLTAAAAGVVTAGLAVKLTGRGWAGWIAYALFLAHPAVAWNLRALRAEWPASLLVLGGLALWMPASPESRPRSFLTGLLSGLGLSGAVLFHMTAVYVLIPAGIAGAVLSRRSRFHAGWWTGLALGMLLFAFQTVRVTDPYWILDNFMSPARRNFVVAGMLLLVAGALAARAGYRRLSALPYVPVAAGLLMSLGVCAVVLLSLRFRGEHGQLPFLPAWSAAYISLTDFQGVMRVMSRVWFLVALCGLPVLCSRSAPGRWIFFVLAPAAMTIGWVVNYMFETRRMVTFLVPLLVLATVALLDVLARVAARYLPETIPMRKQAPALAVTLVTAGLAAVAARGRTQLYTTWNLKGTFGYYRTLARAIEPEADFLFAEYTQTAVPLSALTGLPLLPLAWEYRSETELAQAQDVWREKVLADPGRRYVLVSPFSGSAVPGLAMAPLRTASLRTRVLGRARRDVPRDVNRRTRTLHVHRLLPPGEVAPREPYLREFLGSRLGIEGKANRMGARAAELEGIRLDEQGAEFSAREAEEWVLMVAYPNGVPDADPEVAGGSFRRVRMGPHWEAVHVIPEAGSAPRLRHSEFAFLCQAFVRNGGEMTAVPLPADPVSFVIPDKDSQWIRAESAMAVPEHAGRVWIWIFAQHSRPDVEELRLTLAPGDGAPAGEMHLTGDWRWHAVPLTGPPEATGVFRWLRLRAESGYDPEIDGFPADLGFRIHQLAAVPEL